MTIEQTHRRRQAVGTIHDIVAAMRAIAAGRIQGAQRALANARRYQDVVTRSLARLANESPWSAWPPIDGHPALLIMLTSEQPFCGAFNQSVLDLAEKRRGELSVDRPVRLAVVGQRGIKLAQLRGWTFEFSETAATSLGGLRDLVKRLARRLDLTAAQRKTGPVHVIYNRYRSVSEQEPTSEQVLPLDLKQADGLQRSLLRPFRYLPPPPLLAGLVSESAFIHLYRMVADSFAGEQASRLIAMDAAARNTERMGVALANLERRERQLLATQQVLELIGARFAIE